MKSFSVTSVSRVFIWPVDERFDSFDLLFTGRALSVDRVAKTLVGVAESSLYQ